MCLDPRGDWAYIPEKDKAGMNLTILKEHWDELRVQIDIAEGKGSWREIKAWNELSPTLSK